MKLIKKVFTALLLSFLILNLSNITFAEVKEIKAEGEYRLGDVDSREIAEYAALSDAKRKIIEQVGVYVESYNFNLSREDLKNCLHNLN